MPALILGSGRGLGDLRTLLSVSVSDLESLRVFARFENSKYSGKGVRPSFEVRSLPPSNRSLWLDLVDQLTTSGWRLTSWLVTKQLSAGSALSGGIGVSHGPMRIPSTSAPSDKQL